MKQITRNGILEQLKNPRKEARGYTRWWWFGCAVTEEEICRELDYMHEAGIGGVELQILYPVCADNEEKDIKNQQYLSPEFFHYIRFAATEAKKRDMKFDMTLGSSWPYGGPFVTEEYSAPNVIPYMLDVKGPCKFEYDFTTRLYGKCVGCVMGKMKDCEMLPETIVDITDKVEDKYLFRWEWGKQLTTIDVPEGDYKIVIFISNEKRQSVLKPLPGGDGPIIDHNRKDALRHFLKYGGDPIAEKVGVDLIQSFFCDSIEVFGQNWTDIVYDEFKKRRGYELRPYIYGLWGNIAGKTEMVRYDFQKTLAELTVENFFEELTKWCHEKGATSRIQAHGTWGDILQAYGAADIPEGETFSEYDRYEVNTVHRKLASSAGHVYHKDIISNESFTWLRFPRFVVTLENIKAAVDSIFLDGMNQIVNHGYAYSPKEEGVLGWPFYASSQINHTNTWWPDYKEISTYINRVCHFVQQGKTKVKVGIYLPQADIWAENPLSDIHMCMKLEERLTTPLVDSIHKEGFWFDYVNDDVVTRWSDYEYEAILILECERIPVDTAQSFKEYAQNGGIVICKGHVPSKACGLLNHEENEQKIHSIFSDMINLQSVRVTKDTIESVLDTMHKMMTPDVSFKFHKNEIGYVHRVCENQEIYLISNISPEWKQEQITFSEQTNHCLIFDAMTANEIPVMGIEQNESTTDVQLTFEPYQSLIFIFSSEIEENSTIVCGGNEQIIKDISEDWEFMIPHKIQKHYEILSSWEQESKLTYYSGEGIYTKEITISDQELDFVKNGGQMWIQFEHIGETADIRIDGEYAGRIIKRPYRLNLGHYVNCKQFRIEVRVRNLLINQAIDPEYPQEIYEEAVIEQWPYATGKINQVREERVFNWRETSIQKEPKASGIWGNIQLLIENEKIEG